MTDSLKSPADLADVLGIEEHRVFDLRRIYNWPHVRLGRTIRFTPEQVEAIIAQHSQESEANAPILAAGQTARSAASRRSA